MVCYDRQVALQVSTLQCQRTAYSKLAADNEVILTKLAELQGSAGKGSASGVRPVNLECESVNVILTRREREYEIRLKPLTPKVDSTGYATKFTSASQSLPTQH